MVPSGIVATGYPAVRDKCRDLGIVHEDWQQGLGRLMLGKRKDGKYAATVGGIVMSLARQVGKTFTVGTIIFALCMLFPGMTVLWTAHRTRTANETFRAMQGMARRSKIKPYIKEIRRTNGEQEIEFHNGSRIMFGAREAGFGRGFSEVDIEVFDEAQILSEKALEDMVAATNQSRHPAGALLFYMGTPPRPGDPGEAFKNKRLKALENKAKDGGAGFGDMVYVELSADPDADPDDREQWAKANPSYPVHTPVESMLRLRENVGSDESFMIEGLGIWAPTSANRVIDEVPWENAAEPASMAIDRLALAIDVSPDRRMAAVSLAGLRDDGKWHVELDEHRRGMTWVVGWVKARCERNSIRAVVIDGMSPAASLIDELGKARIKVTVTTARDMAAACGSFFDGVMEDQLRHTDQPQVNVALSVARKRPIGDAWGWNRKDAESDITPIVSETLALWGAQNSTVKKPTRNRSGSSGRRAVVL